MKSKKESGNINNEKIKSLGRMGNWFQTLCFVHIPVVGFIYMVVMAIKKSTPEAKRDFARAYLLYRCLVLFLAVTIIIFFYKLGLGFVDDLLTYAKLA